MTVVDDSLSERDIGVLARLHVESLPDSLISVVGERYARVFYRHLSSSRDEFLYLERGGANGTDVVGACVVSLHPETLNRRLLRTTPLLPMSMMAITRLPLRSIFAKLLAKSRTPAATQPSGPEIILIFTLPGLRGVGSGTRLLMRAESWLAARGVERVFVKTRDVADNRAIRFYEKAGFRRIASIVKQGKNLALFDKHICHDFSNKMNHG